MTAYEKVISKITRDDRVSHSLVACIFDGGHFQTKQEALHNCIRASEGENIRTPQTNRQLTGSVLENVVMTEGCRRLGLVNLDAEITEKVEHPLLPLEGSLDGMAEANKLVIKNNSDLGIYIPNGTKIVVNGKCPIEVKCTSIRATDTPPNWLGVMQLKAAMSTTQCDFGVLIILFESTDLRVFVYRRDYEFEEQLAEKVIDFDRRIKEKDYFTPQVSRDAYVMNQEADQESVVEIKDNFHIDQYLDLKQKIRDLEGQVDYHQSQIMGDMGNASKGVNEDYVVSWGMINYKAKPERVIPANDAYSIRRKTITVKRAKK